jgi:hypothetical protein
MELPLRNLFGRPAAVLSVVGALAGAVLSQVAPPAPIDQPDAELRVQRQPTPREMSHIHGQSRLLEIQGHIAALAQHLVQTEAECEDCQRPNCVQKVESLCERLRLVRSARDRLDRELAAVQLNGLQETLESMWNATPAVDAVQGICELRERGYVGMSSRGANRCEADIVLELNP